jgi:lipid-binding SYLF domain-containing protein
LRGGILSYSRSRGLFIGIKLEGSMLAQHFEANRSLYDQQLTAEDILLKRKVRMPPSGYKLLKLLEQFPLKK